MPRAQLRFLRRPLPPTRRLLRARNACAAERQVLHAASLRMHRGCFRGRRKQRGVTTKRACDTSPSHQLPSLPLPHAADARVPSRLEAYAPMCPHAAEGAMRSRAPRCVGLPAPRASARRGGAAPATEHDARTERGGDSAAQSPVGRRAGKHLRLQATRKREREGRALKVQRGCGSQSGLASERYGEHECGEGEDVRTERPGGGRA
eukprot:4338597-Pleurochrysis_carterae.AAC.1